MRNVFHNKTFQLFYYYLLDIFIRYIQILHRMLQNIQFDFHEFSEKIKFSFRSFLILFEELKLDKYINRILKIIGKREYGHVQLIRLTTERALFSLLQF